MRTFIRKVAEKLSRLRRPKDPVRGKGALSVPVSSLPVPETRIRSHPERRKQKERKSPDYGEGQGTVLPPGGEDWRPSHFKVPPLEGKTRFHDFNLPDPLLHAIQDMGFQYCTPIQAEILPSTLSGKDAGGRAQTGTGKTAAFLITAITRLLHHPLSEPRKTGLPRVLVLAPTRELVLQIADEARRLCRYTDIQVSTLFGGMDYEKQRKTLTDRPVDIVVATPGRLLDFIRSGVLSLKRVEILVIDEADRMLDMGFIPDVRKIVHATPPKDRRQTLLFSATLTEAITRLAAQWTRDPVMVEIEPEQVAVDTVEQVVYIVTLEQKFALLYHIIERKGLHKVLIFCNRRDEVRRLTEMLNRYGIHSSELSGDIPQEKRIKRLEQFKAGKIRVLVATDVAGRGLHIEGMDHVINYHLPFDPEDYVHRIGRTGRAGAVGTSISFADEAEAFYIPPIEEYIGKKLNCVIPDEEWLELPPLPKKGTKKTDSGRSLTASSSRGGRRKGGRGRGKKSLSPVPRP
jgi:ATP-dependent RNA helicase RhlB